MQESYKSARQHGLREGKLLCKGAWIGTYRSVLATRHVNTAEALAIYVVVALRKKVHVARCPRQITTPDLPR